MKLLLLFALVLTAHCQTVYLRWTDPMAPSTRTYALQRSSGPCTPQSVTTGATVGTVTTPTPLALTDQGLMRGVFCYQVFITVGIGQGNRSNQVEVTLPDDPDAPKRQGKTGRPHRMWLTAIVK